MLLQLLPLSLLCMLVHWQLWRQQRLHMRSSSTWLMNCALLRCLLCWQVLMQQQKQQQQRRPTPSAAAVLSKQQAVSKQPQALVVQTRSRNGTSSSNYNQATA
jgi:hypothetical protein